MSAVKVLHDAQAKIYAYLYCLEHGLEQCRIQMTYYHIGIGKESNFLSGYTFAE